MFKRLREFKKTARSKGFWSLFGAGLAVSVATKGAEAELVEVATQSFTQLSDGSLQVTFANGRSVIVPAGDWTLVDGRLFIENTAISQSGAGTSSVVQTSGGQGFLSGINPGVLAGGAAALGFLASSASGSDDSGTTIRASGLSLSGKIDHLDGSGQIDTSLDNAGTVVIADISSIFTGAAGTVTYTYEVTDSQGTVVTDLVRLDGVSLKIVADPTVDRNGVYTVRITGTDTANDNTAVASVFVEVDVTAELLRANGTTITGTVDHLTDAGDTDITLDDANTIVIPDVSTIFTGAQGAVTYSIVVTNSSGSTVPGLFYLNGSALNLLIDPTASQNDTYTIAVTGTDTSNSATATANVFVTLDVGSEAVVQGMILDENKILTQNSGTLVVSDLSQYFDNPDGTFTYSVEVRGASIDPNVSNEQIFNNVLTVSGTELRLSSTLSDTFVETLNNNGLDEDIILDVVVTATDSADGTAISQVPFQLTLDTTGINDSPELLPGAASSYTIDQQPGGAALTANASIDTLNLAQYVTDDETMDSTTLTWSISGSTEGSYTITNGTLAGNAGAIDETLTIQVSDGDPSSSVLSLSVFIDVLVP